jgi:lipoprotein-anchoring transpeptidase ErfK/SrfK
VDDGDRGRCGAPGTPPVNWRRRMLRTRIYEVRVGWRRVLIPLGSAVTIASVVSVAALAVGGSQTKNPGHRSGARKHGERPNNHVVVARQPVDRLAVKLAQANTSVVAATRTSSIAVSAGPSSGRQFRRLRNPNEDGERLVFLVKAKRGAWLQVYLPTRPNGSVGWIRRSRVRISFHSFRVRIELRRHRLTASRGLRVVAVTSVAVGDPSTPTPTGGYYITELLKDPGGAYGPYAFGLSVHSNVLREFAGGDGILGLHGTDEPDSIGRSVSHGCIRVSNAAITRLAKILPIGTPVQITNT